MRLQWAGKDFDEYKLRVSNLIRTLVILQAVCVDANDIWKHEASVYVPDREGDPDHAAEPDTVTGAQLHSALYDYVNRRVTMDIATGRIERKWPQPPPPPATFLRL